MSYIGKSPRTVHPKAGKVLLARALVSSSTANVTWTHGTGDVVFDSTYIAYEIVSLNFEPVTDEKLLQIQWDTSGATSYGQAHTSAGWRCLNRWDGGTQNVENDISMNSHNSTDGQNIIRSSEGTYAGYYGYSFFTLFNPANTTYMKVFMNDLLTSDTGNNTNAQSYSINGYSGGYVHTTSALTTIKLSCNSGNIDQGEFHLYGIKDDF